MTSTQNEHEEWREVLDTKGFYQVSNLGRVRSKFGKGGWRILKQHLNSQGYPRVNLKLPKAKDYFVHRLVAVAFVPNPAGLPVVNHKDFNRANCDASNLEWTTLQGNYQYSAERGRYERTGAWLNRLTTTLRKKMGRAVVGKRISDGAELYLSSLNQCKEFGFQPSCVSNCCAGKRKQTGGYTWRYATIQDARALGIETRPEEKIRSLLEEWE